MSIVSVLQREVSPTTLAYGVWLVQLASTLMMTGLIWLIQLVHYPLLAFVGKGDTFTAYTLQHTERITYLVAPLMLAEAGCAVLWLYLNSILGLPAWHMWAGLVLVLIIWAATAFLSVPCHNILTGMFDAPTIQRLVDGNWVRTVAWSLRAGLVLYGTWLLMQRTMPVPTL
jgi:hypothetical protein